MHMRPGEIDSLGTVVGSVQAGPFSESDSVSWVPGKVDDMDPPHMSVKPRRILWRISPPLVLLRVKRNERFVFGGGRKVLVAGSWTSVLVALLEKFVGKGEHPWYF